MDTEDTKKRTRSNSNKDTSSDVEVVMVTKKANTTIATDSPPVKDATAALSQLDLYKVRFNNDISFFFSYIIFS